MVKLSSGKPTVNRRNRTEWAEINRAILTGLDLRAEFVDLGVVFAAERPSSDGWIPCHSIDRQDNNPSAAVCLSSSNGCLGRYKDHGPGGPEKAISLYDLAVRVGRFPDFKSAQKHYAERAGVALSTGRSSPESARNVCDEVELIQSERLASVMFYLWTSHKQGVSLEVAKRIARLCRWPKNRHPQDQFTCIGFPAFDPRNWDSPTAIILYRADGKNFPATKTLPERKTHLVRGSSEGLIRACTRDELASAEVSWKCEGVPDMLALALLLPAGHVAVTNACGAKSFPPHLAAAFSGKRVMILHDADAAGESGAAIVAKAVVPVASKVCRVRLPYPISESHGKDVRDFICEGGTIQQLLALAEQSESRPRPDTAAAEARDDTDAEENDDIEPDQIANAEEVMGPGDDRPTVIPLPLNDVLELIRRKTDGWPRRVGSALFVHDAGGQVSWLESTPAMFGWLQAKCGVIAWHKTKGCATREECYCEFQRTAEPYVSVEEFPHWPPIAAHYYTRPAVEPGDGAALREFIGRFKPATEIDGDLIQAALLTLLWGGDGGTRPAFIFTADKGRGRGKSKCAELLARVVGGAMDFSANEKIGDIKARLLSGGALARRVALLDNVKSLRFSWSELEGLITAPVISGKRMYVGEASRPNTLTWFITLNGASLSTDMAQRSVVIKIGEPDRSDTWEDDAKAFVDRNRDKIIADAIGMLQSPGDHLKQCSRWATWERSVLSCLPEPSDAQKAILEQQKAVDVEREEAAVIEEHFRHQLGGIGYPTETHKVFIPSNLAAQWFIEATGEKKSVVAIGRILSQLISEGRMASLQKSACNENGRGFVWYGPKSTAEVKIAKDIRARIAELLRQREEAARQDQLRRLRETAPST